MKKLRGLCIGAGYFSQFHFDAWLRIPGVELVAVCDADGEKAQRASQQFGIPRTFTDPAGALDELDLDFVDIITPPATHLPLIEQAARAGPAVICQKPLAPDVETAWRIAEMVRKSGIRFMVHENFRFQPWYREIKQLLDNRVIGHRLHSLYFRSRLGDGWGDGAYLSRQPYFRDMKRFLIHETGVHFIDTFRFLAGQVEDVSAILRRLNPAIQGEDAGLLILRFASGAVGTWDANRFNEGTEPDPRYTFGEFLVEGDGGSIRLYTDGRVTIQPLGEPERAHAYTHEKRGFAGDCVFATQLHFVQRLLDGGQFETNIDDYLKTLAVQEAAYQSAVENRPVQVLDSISRPPDGTSCAAGVPAKAVASAGQGLSAVDVHVSRKVPFGGGDVPGRITDLTLPIDEHLPRASVQQTMTIDKDGWNATTLTLYSHCGTHMDAPKHFLEDGRSIDQQALDVCCGQARVLDLTPIAPRELISIQHMSPWAESIQAGDRLLLRTDWYKRFGTAEYRDQLPRISLDLAEWLVERGVALIGVEPPSVADVKHLEELTAVHQTLLRGNVLIIEGLAHLDQLESELIEFIALPLNVTGGDGSPVRAIAIER